MGRDVDVAVEDVVGAGARVRVPECRSRHVI
jgi:hypothetical protein